MTRSSSPISPTLAAQPRRFASSVDAKNSLQFKRVSEKGEAAVKKNDMQPQNWFRRHFERPNVWHFDANMNAMRGEPPAGQPRFLEVRQPIPISAQQPGGPRFHAYLEAENERVEYRPISSPLAPLPNLHVGQPPHMAPGVMTYMRGSAYNSQIHHQTPLVYAEQPHYPGYVPVAVDPEAHLITRF